MSEGTETEFPKDGLVNGRKGMKQRRCGVALIPEVIRSSILVGEAALAKLKGLLPHCSFKKPQVFTDHSRASHMDMPGVLF